MVLRESLPFWAANGMFLLTGCIMIILNQQLGYYRANSPFSFFAGLAQYTGMLAGGLAWLSRRGGRLFPNGLHSRRVLPIAATNLAVAFFSVLGILDLGSGLFIIVYAFVTVLAALIRWAVLKKQLFVHQWAAVVAITVALVGAGVAEQRGLGPDISLAGLAYTVTATLMDAIMYVFTEHALEPPAGRGAEGVTPHRGPDPAELCTLVGLFNFPVAAFYVVTVVAHGRWDDYVAEPIAHNGCGGTQMLALGLWVAQSGVYFGHYMSFYYTVGGSSSVAAGVNKAVQGGTIFTLSHLFYCPAGPALLMQAVNDTSGMQPTDEALMWPVLCTTELLGGQCFSAPKGIAVAVVAISSVVYSCHPTVNHSQAAQADKAAYAVVSMTEAVE